MRLEGVRHLIANVKKIPQFLLGTFPFDIRHIRPISFVTQWEELEPKTLVHSVEAQLPACHQVGRQDQTNLFDAELANWRSSKQLLTLWFLLSLYYPPPRSPLKSYFSGTANTVGATWSAMGEILFQIPVERRSAPFQNAFSLSPKVSTPDFL